MRGLKDKVIVITGGCGDLGAATARRITEEGARAVLMDILPEKDGNARAESVGAAAYYVCDHSNRPAVDSALSVIAERFGRIDVAIVNAAMVRAEKFEEISLESWNEYLRVNLTGYFHVAQSAVRIFLRQPLGANGVRGKVLFTSSWTAQHPLPGNLPYVVTKGAIETMARAMAQELATKQIRVNALAPGMVYAGLTKKICDTNPGTKERILDLVPLNSLGTAEQVGDAYAFLCSSDSDYMTGQVMTVDGGCSVIKR
jgi:NAD(P)-dependent dehydrogenase (short-subunit alcohol dehydrogenase family)